MICKDLRIQALSNATHFVDPKKRFPMNVFSFEWSEFLFFDSGWMFHKSFVGVANDLLSCEGGGVACLVNLDQYLGGDAQDEFSLFMDSSMTGQEYLSLLDAEKRGAASGVSWGTGIDRFSFASDAGQWTIYCEKNNEIAVIAFRNLEWRQKFTPSLIPLGAATIDEGIEKQLIYGFTPRVLTPAWKAAFLENYMKHEV